ncbi:MAG: type I-E CRISPR-associated protein Cas5/CasD [Oscillospiraceae bacterium]|nr:type I-E CRISPR-associated protein Cas5/CasD [Oscillospiraceae bacterium]
MATLLLRLAGPLQSWGSESKFEVRRTMGFPTKSGVIGMLASALGYSREDSLDKLNKLKFGVRVDREGRLIRDYHTAMGEKPYVTNRYYLSDAIFLVGLESDDRNFLNAVENALKNPAFPLFLGRRSCPPTMPLLLGIRDANLMTSLKNERWLLEEWRQKWIDKYNKAECKLRIITDSDDNDGIVIRDVPISFSPIHRKFGWRRVKEHGYIDKSTDIKSTEHNAMSELG